MIYSYATKTPNSHACKITGSQYRGSAMAIQIQKRDFSNAGVVHPEIVTPTVVVIPCFNEEDRLPANEFLDFIDQTSGISFLFVNDGSTDQTAERLANLCEQRPKVFSAISLDQNSGKAEAVRQGLLHATSTGANFVGYWDADLATPLDAIEDFLRIANRFDDVSVIFGSRRMLLGHRIKRTFFRRCVSQICSSLAYQALQVRVGDTQCGAKLFRNSHSLKLSLRSQFTAGWLFDIELFSRMSKQIGAKPNAFFELPLAEWEEVAGSKVSSKAIFKAGISMLGLIAENRLGLTLRRKKTAATPTASVISTNPKLLGKFAT